MIAIFPSSSLLRVLPVIMPSVRASFSPSDIAGLVLWLKADAGLFEDAAKAVPAVDDGDAIYTWADQSGSGNDAVQATAANRPTLKLAIQNGKPVARFDGVNDHFLEAITLSGAKTIFAVFANTANPGVGEFDSILTLKDSGAALFAELLLMNLGGYQPYTWKHDVTGGSAAGVGIADALNTSFHILEHSYDGVTPGATGSYLATLDGVSKTIVASGAIGRTSTDKGAIGARVTDVDALTAIFTGDIAELLVYNSVLSTADRQSVETYLNAKYAVY